MAAIVPGTARWLQYIYPLDKPCYVFYHGCVIQARAGGQQGCPLMKACHAVVQGSPLEALGIVKAWSNAPSLLPVMHPAAQLDMSPMFADERFLTGSAAEVQRSVEHLVDVMPRLGLTFSRCEVIPAAGSRGVFDEDAFLRLGCSVKQSGNMSIMKISVGSTEYCEGKVQKRMEAAARIATTIGNLPDAHCSVNLLHFQTGRMDYTCRTTPAEQCEHGLRLLNASIKAGFETVVSMSFNNMEWRQVTLPIK